MQAVTLLAPRTDALSRFLADFRVPLTFALFAASAGLELGQRSLTSTPLWRPPAAPVIGYVLIAVGLFVRSWAAGTLRKGNALATVGPYSLCRHPLYLGSGLMILGFCSLVCEPWNYVHSVIGVGLIYANTMFREEQRLAEQYATWPEYRRRTPFCFPWLPQRFAAGPWSAAQWRKNHEYQAFATSLAGVAVIEAARTLS